MVDVRLVALPCVSPVSLLVDLDALALCDLEPLLPCLPLHLEVVTKERGRWLVRGHGEHAIEGQEVVALSPLGQLSVAELVKEAPLGHLRTALPCEDDLVAQEQEPEVWAVRHLEPLAFCDLAKLLLVVHGRVPGFGGCWLVGPI